MFMSKEDMRQQVQRAIALMSSDAIQEESAAICSTLQTLEASSIAAFIPLLDEPNILPFLAQWIASGNTLFLPRFEENRSTFHTVETLDALEEGPYGIQQPPQETPMPDPQDIDTVLVPGRAFDRNGGRLGRGKGGYDRWIAAQREKNPQTQFMGIAFDCQVVDTVPMEERDERMDVILTSNGIMERECDTNGKLKIEN